MNKSISANIQCSDACNTNFVYSNCNPLDRSQWQYQTNKVPQGMDPTYFNTMNGCWICNNAEEIAANQYLCKRNFALGTYDYEIKEFGPNNTDVIRKIPMLLPCNKITMVNKCNPK
jgi:hypothetical protein